MSKRPSPSSHTDPAMEAYLLGRVEFSRCCDLQQRLVYESGGRADGQIALLVCEHPPIITIGRRGSWAHLNAGERELRSRQVPLRWVNRGGGCLVHAPGQLAVYPIVPLAWHRLSVGRYLELLQSGIGETLAELGLPLERRPGRFGLWGRSGQIVAVAAAVKDWTSYFGAYVNVSTPLGLLRLVESDPEGHSPMSSLAAERSRRVKMTRIREALVRHLSAAFGCRRCHIHTGHPLLDQTREPVHDFTAGIG